MFRFPVTLNAVARESQNPVGIKDAKHYLAILSEGTDPLPAAS
jgi:hypothetical protein